MKTNRVFSIVAILVLCLASTPFQAQAQHQILQSNNQSGSARSGDETELSNPLAQSRPQNRPALSLMPAINLTPAAIGPSLTVIGGGTLGRLTKWTGFNSSNSFIGDSTIFESKSGLVGIGTDSPTSKLTVAGMIQSTGGGFRFPDGTVQTTSAAGSLFTVTHDATLTGDGTPASPLSVVSPEAFQEPFLGFLGFNIPSGEDTNDFDFDIINTVPSGKRLVIEHVSGRCALPTGQRLSSFSIGAEIGTFQELIPVYIGDFNFLGGVSVVSVSSPLRRLVSSGTQVRVFVDRGQATPGEALCNVTISGYLINEPVLSLK